MSRVVRVDKVIRGILVTPFEQFPGEIVIEDGIITEVVPGNRTRAGAEVMDFGDCFVCPGFVDLHIHGAGGSDVLDGSSLGLETMSRFLAAHGVTCFLGTVTTAPVEAMVRAIEVAAAAMSQAPAKPLSLRGIHLEGPHISVDKLGAQDPECVLSPENSPILQLIERFPGLIRTVTLAPEVPGAESLVQSLVSKGIKVSAGHSNASFDQVQQAFGWGVNRVTHLFNAMSQVHHRYPGLAVAALLNPNVYVELIADGVHVHPAMVQLACKVKGPERVCLITDSIRAAGLGDGTYTLGRLDVTVKGNQARLQSGALAGSVLTMDQAVRNVMSFAQVPLTGAVMMASYTPAEAVGLEDRVGSLDVGKDADIVVLNADLEVQMTLVRGVETFRRG